MKTFFLSFIFLIALAATAPAQGDSYRRLQRWSEREWRKEQKRKVHLKNGLLQGDSIIFGDSIEFCKYTYRKGNMIKEVSWNTYHNCDFYYRNNRLRRSVCYFNDKTARKEDIFWREQQVIIYKKGQLKSITEYYWTGGKRAEYRNGRWKKWGCSTGEEQ